MRVLIVVTLAALLAAATGFGVYEWRSPSEPARMAPIELRPPPERKESPRPPSRERAGPTSSAEVIAPPAPAPVVGGGEDDDGDDAGTD